MTALFSRTSYNNEFFSKQVDGALESARVMAPLVINLLQPRSVVDVGCGRGAWLRAFADCGVDTICGVDGNYVDRSKLLIDPACFHPANLAGEFTLDRAFDLAVCLEVAEHIPDAQSRYLVKSLTKVAPSVLFSAALPGQDGVNHINEQWPGYWRDRFAECGFAMFDPFRPNLRNDRRIAWWYRQNVLLFANDTARASHPSLEDYFCGADADDIEWVHALAVRRHPGIREVLRALPFAFGRSLGRHLHRSRRP
jgi:SAM-dependent methyltransferase